MATPLNLDTSSILSFPDVPLQEDSTTPTQKSRTTSASAGAFSSPSLYSQSFSSAASSSSVASSSSFSSTISSVHPPVQSLTQPTTPTDPETTEGDVELKENKDIDNPDGGNKNGVDRATEESFNYLLANFSDGGLGSTPGSMSSADSIFSKCNCEIITNYLFDCLFGKQKKED